MRWDDRVFNGMNEGYHWLVSRRQIDSLGQLVVEAHCGLRLCITSFDSGAIRPNPEEAALGWTMHGDVMVSPALRDGLEIPSDQYDEWYVLESPVVLPPDLERFVSYGGFNLVDPQVLIESFDPTWDRHGLDYLAPIQERFWAQLTRISPATYVAMGDQDVLVSRNKDLVDRASGVARLTKHESQ